MTPATNPLYDDYLRIASHLVTQGGDVNQPDIHGKTPIHFAVIEKAEHAIDDLIRLGAKEAVTLEGVATIAVAMKARWRNPDQGVRMMAGANMNCLRERQPIVQSSENSVEDEPPEEELKALRLQMQQNRSVRL